MLLFHTSEMTGTFTSLLWVVLHWSSPLTWLKERCRMVYSTVVLEILQRLTCVQQHIGRYLLCWNSTACYGHLIIFCASSLAYLSSIWIFVHGCWLMTTVAYNMFQKIYVSLLVSWISLENKSSDKVQKTTGFSYYTCKYKCVVSSL